MSLGLSKLRLGLTAISGQGGSAGTSLYAIPLNPIAQADTNAELFLYDGRGDNAGTVDLNVGGSTVTPTSKGYAGIYTYSAAAITAKTNYTWTVDGEVLAQGVIFPNTASLLAHTTSPSITPEWGYVGDTFSVTLGDGSNVENELLANGRSASISTLVNPTQAGSISIVSRVSDTSGADADGVETDASYVLEVPTDLDATFGDDDAVGEAALDTNFVAGGPVAQGTYTGAWGEFSVDADGVMTPNAALTAGSYTVGGISVTVRAGVRTVADDTELDSAITAYNTSGGTIELRYGYYGWFLDLTLGNSLTAPLTIKSADTDHKAQFKRITLQSVGNATHRLEFTDVKVYASYDDALYNNTGLSWNGGGDDVAQVDLDTAQNLEFSRVDIESDFQPSYVNEQSVPWLYYKRNHQVRNKVKIFRSIDGEGLDNVDVNNVSMSSCGGGIWLSGDDLTIHNNDIEDYWFDPFNLYAPSDGVTMTSNTAFNVMGSYIHPDFLQAYDKTGPNREILNLTIARNILGLGDKSAQIIHDEDGTAFPKHQFIFTQSLDTTAGANTGWIVEDNIGVCFGQHITMPNVTGAIVRRNTITPMYKDGVNPRVADVEVYYADAQNCVTEYNTGKVTYFVDSGGNTATGNVEVSDTDVTSQEAAFVGTSFEMEDMTSLSDVISALRMKPNGTLDADNSGVWNSGDAGSVGETTSSGPVDWSSRPYESNIVTPSIVEASPTFVDGTGSGFNYGTFTAGSGSNRKVIVCVATFDSSTGITNISVDWGGVAGEQMEIVNSSFERVAMFQFEEADFPSGATGTLSCSFTGGTANTATITAFTVQDAKQVAAASMTTESAFASTDDITVPVDTSLLIGFGNGSNSQASMDWTAGLTKYGSTHIYGGTATAIVGQADVDSGLLTCTHNGTGRTGIILAAIDPV